MRTNHQPAGSAGLPTMLPGLPGTPRSRAAVAAASALAALLAAYGILRLQIHYVAKQDGGASLSRWTQLIADGSGMRTSVGPWVAAILFGLTARRVLTRPPEPPLGPAGERDATAGEVRHALRRELDGMRWLLLGVGALAALDVGRVLVNVAYATVRGNAVARAELGWTSFEALGLVLAAAALTVAVRGFRQQVSDLGALAGAPEPRA